MTRHFHPSSLEVLSATTHPTGPAPTISRSGFCIQQKTISNYYSKKASAFQGAVRKFQSRCKAAFLDNLAILPVRRAEDDCTRGRSRCIGKRNKVGANKACSTQITRQSFQRGTQFTICGNWCA